MKRLNSSRKPVWASICRGLLKKKSVDDIILFGSTVKGKRRPRDVDICLVLKEPDDRLPVETAEAFERRGLTVHLTTTSFTRLLEDPLLWQTLLHEGISLKHGKPLAEILGMRPLFLFTYDMKRLSISGKQAFSHALSGTGGRTSLLRQIGAIRIGRTAVLVPAAQAEEMRAILDRWEITYRIRRVWM